jgi:hypothetical protein
MSLLDDCIQTCQRYNLGTGKLHNSWYGCRMKCMLNFREKCAETYITGKVNAECEIFLRSLTPHEPAYINIPSTHSDQRQLAERKGHCDQTAVTMFEFAASFDVPQYRLQATSKCDGHNCSIRVCNTYGPETSIPNHLILERLEEIIR